VVRTDLRFPCGEVECAGWLHAPARRAPVVVMAHGFAGTRDLLSVFAESFAAEGLAVFVFDYRGFGASGGAPRQLVDPWSQLEDWRAALRFVRGLAAVDPEHVAVWGSSLGGGLALMIAAEDARVGAAVAQAPLVDSDVEGEAPSQGVVWALRLLLTAWADLASSALGRGSVTMPAIAPRGGFAMIVDDAAYAAFQGLVPPGSSYRNEVAARSPLTFDGWNPAPHVARIACPTLLVASRSDRFVPFTAVEAAARANPRVEVAEFEGDHFEVYVPPAREVAAEAAATFLVRWASGPSAPPGPDGLRAQPPRAR
jgi:hypothetical protein